jgi:hypothetical protein
MKNGPDETPAVQLIDFRFEADALTHIWRVLRASKNFEWPQLVDLSFHRADGSDLNFGELLSWADFGGGAFGDEARALRDPSSRVGRQTSPSGTT